MDLDAYLRRVGYDRRIASDLVTLSALHTAHVCSIPFENLDVQLGRRLTTSVAEAYEKIVTRRRGGWCYEQNGLFGWALSQIGFGVTRIAASVRRPNGRGSSDASHLCLIVESDQLEGRYLVDVGFGGSLVRPLVLEETEDSQPPFRVGLKRLDDGRWRFWEDMGPGEFGFDFSVTAACEQSLTDTCVSLQSDRASSFVMSLVAQLRSHSEHRILRGRVFTTATATGVTTETLGSPSALVDTLADIFRLDVPEAAGLWPRIAKRHDELLGSLHQQPRLSQGNPMHAHTKFVLVVALASLGGPGALSAQDCDPEGDVQFVCGPGNPEDLVAVPESSWVIASGMEDNGHLYRVDIRDHTSEIVFPTGSSIPRFDRELYGACPGPAVEEFRPHGVSLRPGPDGVHTLYVVRHGLREAVEVFEVDAVEDAPTLTWVGCVVAPEGVGLNSVAALPGTAFAVTNFQRPVGEVWEWESGGGWTKVPGSETSGPNGLVATPDGRWLYVGGWGTQSLIRLSRGESEPRTDSVDVGFHIDNVRWGPDGALLAAGHHGDTPESIFECLGQGQCDSVTSRVAQVDPESLEAEEIVRYPSNDLLPLGTVAIQVGDEIWVGGIGGDRIIRLEAPTP